MRKEEIDVIEKFIEANKAPFPGKLGVYETNIVVEMIYEIWKRGNEKDWIPTAKRLPEKDDVTYVLLAINGCKGIIVRSGWYYDGGFHSDTGDYYRMDNKKDAEMVLAWMPQPEPYIKDWRKHEEVN